MVERESSSKKLKNIRVSCAQIGPFGSTFPNLNHAPRLPPHLADKRKLSGK